MSTATSSAGNRPRALKCRHFCNPWDLHNYCPTCREAFKGDNYISGKGKCMVCASFTEEQQQKIAKRKRYVKKDKAVVSNVSKDESELLGEPDQGDIFEGSQQELGAFTSPHPNRAMSYWESPSTGTGQSTLKIPELPPYPIYSREVDLGDLLSQNTEDIETFRQVLGIPDP